MKHFGDGKQKERKGDKHNKRILKEVKRIVGRN